MSAGVHGEAGCTAGWEVGVAGRQVQEWVWRRGGWVGGWVGECVRVCVRKEANMRVSMQASV